MILDQSLIPALLITAVIGGVLALTNVLGSNIYEIKELQKQKQRTRHPYAKAYRNRPLITIVIPSHNEGQYLEACLQAVRKSSYRKYEIIVLDNASSDDSKRRVKAFITKYPKQAVRLIAKRSAADPLSSVKTAYSKYGQGQLLMILSPKSTIDTQALARAVQHFNAQPTIDILLPNQRARIDFKMSGLIQAYKDFLTARWKKFVSVAHVPRTPSLYGTMSRPTAVLPLLTLGKRRGASRRQRLLEPHINYHFASDVALYTTPPQSFYQLGKWHYQVQLKYMQTMFNERGRLFSKKSYGANLLISLYLTLIAGLGVLSIVLPLLISYFIYLALRLHEPTLLIVAVLLLSITLLSAIWSDNHVAFTKKLTFSLLIPITYAVFYVMAFIQVLAVLSGLTSYPLTLASRE